MFRLSGNISTLFPGLPLDQRFAAAQALGFDAVEIQYPYEMEVSAIRDALARNGQRLHLINAPLGAGTANRGLACLPGRQAEFRSSVSKALEYASKLDTALVHVLSGLAPEDASRDEAEATALENFAWGAEQAGKAGIVILLEALNDIDVPGYFLRSLDDAADIVSAVGGKGIGLLFDVYHCARSGKDVPAAISRHASQIVHVQIADAPDRHEPGTGSVDWSAAFSALRDAGYAGPIGCEFTPRSPAGADMTWAHGFPGLISAPR
jgi:hydroxypyruvate isomerase